MLFLLSQGFVGCFILQSPFPILSASALRAPAEPSQGLLHLKVNHHNAQGKGKKLCSQIEFGPGQKKKKKK